MHGSEWNYGLIAEKRSYPSSPLQAEYFGGFITMSVFGLTALVAAAITMTLPESKNIKLPDSIDEAERIGTNIESIRGKNSP